MLPKNRLGRQMLASCKVYAGPTHPHAAQKPQPLARLPKRRVAPYVAGAPRVPKPSSRPPVAARQAVARVASVPAPA